MSTRPPWYSRLQSGWPSPETLAQQRWLKPFAHLILKPPLWRMQRESVARGVAIGIFWAFVIPLGQTILAVLHCTWWRGNIPAAALMTMLTNPLTFGFWLWLAHGLGNAVLGTTTSLNMGHGTDWLTVLSSASGPVLLGMGIFGLGGATSGYALVKMAWWLRIYWRRRVKIMITPVG